MPPDSSEIRLEAFYFMSLGALLTVILLAVLSILLIARSTGNSGADDGCGNCASTAVLSEVFKVPRS